MCNSSSPLDPHSVKERYALMLAEASLPRFTTSVHCADLHELQLHWDHSFTLHVDLERDDEIAPFDELDRAAILNLPYDQWP